MSDGGSTELVIKAIHAAKKPFAWWLISFTARAIKTALIEAQKSGSTFQIIIDHEKVQPRNHSIAPYMAENYVPLCVDVIHSLQHNKYMVIDDKTVEAGLFNYISVAEYHNVGNVVVLRDPPKLGVAYSNDWPRYETKPTPITSIKGQYAIDFPAPQS